jgi:hypothetical protein
MAVAMLQIGICRVRMVWFQLEEGIWKEQTPDHIRQAFIRLWELANDGWLSKKERKKVGFEIRAILHDLESKAVLGTVESPCFKSGRMKLFGTPVLNRFIPNHIEVPRWPKAPDLPASSDTGPGLMEAFLRRLLGAVDAERFHDLMAVLYRKLIEPESETRNLPALVLVGDPDSGKSLILSKFIGGLVGKKADGTSYFTGADKFNAQLYSSPLILLDDIKNLSERQRDEFYFKAHGLVSVPDKETRGMYAAGYTAPWSCLLAIGLNYQQLEYLSYTSDTRTKFLVLECSAAYAEFKDRFEAEVTKAKGWDAWMRRDVLPHYAFHYRHRKLKYPHHRFCVESYWSPGVILEIPFPPKYRTIHEFLFELVKEWELRSRAHALPAQPDLLNLTPTAILTQAHGLPFLAPIARTIAAKELGAYLRSDSTSTAQASISFSTFGYWRFFPIIPMFRMIPTEIQRTRLWFGPIRSDFKVSDGSHCASRDDP